MLALQKSIAAKVYKSTPASLSVAVRRVHAVRAVQAPVSKSAANDRPMPDYSDYKAFIQGAIETAQGTGSRRREVGFNGERYCAGLAHALNQVERLEAAPR